MSDIIHPNLVMFPDSRLRENCAEVKEIGNQITETVTLMLEVLEACRTAGIDTASIAAPQVGVMLRVFLIDNPALSLVAINPVITKTAGEQTRAEGCLSFPRGTTYMIKRPNVVKIHYKDLTGVEHAGKFHDLYASVVQHEIDHLNGILIDDHLYDVQNGYR